MNNKYIKVSNVTFGALLVRKSYLSEIADRDQKDAAVFRTDRWQGTITLRELGRVRKVLDKVLDKLDNNFNDSNGTYDLDAKWLLNLEAGLSDTEHVAIGRSFDVLVQRAFDFEYYFNESN